MVDNVDVSQQLADESGPELVAFQVEAPASPIKNDPFGSQDYNNNY
jgi:hypothetical protein